MANTNYRSVSMAGVNLYSVDSTQKYPIGTTVTAVDATHGFGEFIYLKGVADTAEGSWVSYDEAGVTALFATGIISQLAVALGATVADTYGWYCRKGKIAASTTSVDDNDAQLYQEAAGQVSDTVTAGDRVYGAIARSATDTPATGLSWVQIDYPFCHEDIGERA